MQKNLFDIAQLYLAQLSRSSVTKEALDAFERDCIARWSMAYKAYKEAEHAGRPPKPAYREWKQNRAKAQQELAVLVPARRLVSAMRQQLKKGKSVNAYELGLLFLTKATRTARSTLLRTLAPETRFGLSRAYFTAQCITLRQVLLAADLLKAHPMMFGEIPKDLLRNVALVEAQAAMDHNELVARKKALYQKIVTRVSLTEPERELLKRFLD